MLFLRRRLPRIDVHAADGVFVEVGHGSLPKIESMLQDRNDRAVSEARCQGAYLAVAAHGPVLPVRAAGSIAAAGGLAPANRPLRVLFMATSPEGVEPVLGFEAEEAAILQATTGVGVEVVVEESGTLEGLRFSVVSYGAGYFDVLHLSGHATVRGGQPTFLVENELGGLAEASAEQIARAVAGQWPRLVFVSGCSTGGAGGTGWSRR